MKKSILVGLSSVGAFLLPVVVFADTAPIWTEASSSATISSAYGTLGVLIALVVGAVIGAWAALVGLGFAKRKATHYVTGKKF